MKRDYKNYRLYLENENLIEEFNLDDILYIALEYLYNLTEKDTAMLKDGLCGSTAYNKVKGYLLKYRDIHIASIQDPKTKVATAYGWYDELVKRGVLSYIGPYTHTTWNGMKQTRKLYEFTEAARAARKEPKEKKDTYTIESNFNVTSLF